MDQKNVIQVENELFRSIYRFEQLIESQFIKEERCDPVEDVSGVDDNHKDEPEPHGQVHFLIDDILKEILLCCNQSEMVTVNEN